MSEVEQAAACMREVLSTWLCMCCVPVSNQDITNKWSEVRELVPRRDQTLQQEMMRQQNNERLRRQFAAKANVVGQWVETQLDAVASIGVQMIPGGPAEETAGFDKAIMLQEHWELELTTR